MQTFKDREGQEWEVDLPYGEVVRIKEESQGKFDLAEPQKDELGKRLDEDLSLFWELLWYIVKPQAAIVMPSAGELRRRGNAQAIPSVSGITAAEFGRRMSGDCLIAADEAFRREWQDFFHQLQRPDQAAALGALNLINSATLAKVRAKVESSEALRTLPDRVSAKVDRMLTKPFEDLQASLDSILNDSPIENSGTATKELPATAAP